MPKRQINFIYRIFSKLLILVLIFVSSNLNFALVAIAASGTPTIISYQGRLADGDGDLLGGSGATYYFKFSIWDNATVDLGSRLWPSNSPATTTATVRQGVFNVNIGDTANGYPDPLNYNFNTNQTVYLQVQVSSTTNAVMETLSPRQQITASSFAELAGAVSGTSTPSSFGTTTPIGNSAVTIEASSSNAVPLSIRAATGQLVNIFQIQDSTAANLLYLNSSGALFASSTLQVTGNSIFYSNLGIGTSTPGATFGVEGSALISGNLTSTNLTATGTITAFGLSTLSGVLSTASSTFSNNLNISGPLSASSTLNVGGLANLSGFISNSSSTISSTLILTGGLNASSTATSTFANGIRLYGGNLQLLLTGCNDTSVLETDAFGNIQCGADSGGSGADTNAENTWTALQTFSVGTLSTASSTFSANLNISGPLSASSTLSVANLATLGGGFLASASSTVGGNFHVSGVLRSSSTLAAGSTTITNLIVSNNASSTFAGGLQATYLNLTGLVSTSTASNGFDLTNGCFSIRGTCVGGGGGGGTTVGGAVTSGTANRVLYEDSGNLLAESANLTFDGSLLTTANLIASASSTFSGTLSVTGNLYASSSVVFSGNGINYLSSATSTIKDNTVNAWSIATSSSAKPLFSINTTSNSEEVIIGTGYTTDVIIGATGTVTNLQFAASSTIFANGNGTTTLTFGDGNDIINFAVATGFGTTSPWRTLSVLGSVGLEGLTATVTAATDLCLSSDKEVVTRVSGTTCAAASSIKFKKDVNSLTETSGLQEIMALRPVSYFYKESFLGSFINSPGWNGEHVGFIAEEVAEIDPRLVGFDQLGQPDSIYYDKITSILAKGLQELNLRVENIASSTATSTPDSGLFAANFFNNIFEKIKNWLADAANGIMEIAANTFRAKEKICVDDQCLTKDDIRKLLELANSQSVLAPDSTSLPQAAPAPEPEPTPAADTESPVITLNWAATIEIEIGTSWVDPGATVTDNMSENLGIHYTVDGVLTANEGNQLPHEIIDTAIAGEHTIIYSAIDQAGNIGTAERKVAVIDPLAATTPVSESEPAPAE